MRYTKEFERLRNLIYKNRYEKRFTKNLTRFRQLEEESFEFMNQNYDPYMDTSTNNLVYGYVKVTENTTVFYYLEASKASQILSKSGAFTWFEK